MHRRDLFKSLLGVTAASVFVTPARKYGRLTVDGHRAHQQLTGESLHVYLDGVEVKGGYEADDVEGYVLVFCRDEQDHRDWTKQGHMHIGGDGGGACRMRLTGNVVIAPGPA